METLLEQQRRYHEERERLMDGMVQVEFIILYCPLVVLIEKTSQERLYTKANHRDSINSEHRQRAMLERYIFFTNDQFYAGVVYLPGFLILI